MTKTTKQKNITAQDVADLAGVSRAAVSRTFSNRGSVSKEARTKVLKAAKELNYQVNVLAQSLNRQRSDLVGLVTSKIHDPYRSQLLEDLIKQIQANGYQALVSEVENDLDMQNTLQKFTQFRVSGVIVTSGRPPAAFAEQCIQHKIPVVVINRETELAHADVVKSDNNQGSQLAAQCLLDAKCQHLAYLNVSNDTYSATARGAAFIQTIAKNIANGDVSFQQITALQPTYQGGMEAAKLAFANGCAFDGIFCANDLLACGFLDGARKFYNLNAPDDFCIIGFDDIPVASFESYKLTTLRQNSEGVAQRALQLLMNRTKDNSSAQVTADISVKLIMRDSVSCR